MKKLALVTAVSAILASPTFAAAVAYTGTAKSGTAANQLASITVQASGATAVWYVATSSGTKTNKTTPAIQLTVGSNWTFDFSNLAAVTFTGDVQYGTYATQTTANAVLATLDGRYTVNNALQTVSGTGSFNAATNTFTYTKVAGAANSNGGSVGTNSGGNICNNGTTLLGQSVCGNATAATPSWEGLALNFVFSADKLSFSGALTATDKSGSGTTANTTTINWQISGSTPAPVVPVPAAAWLFGSGLLGLAGTARRRRSV
jgi:hypothetical protein